MRPIKFYVAGVKFYNLHKVSHKMNEGDSVQLVLEPTNKYDEFAVRVQLDDVMLGYIPKAFSEGVSKAIASGKTLSAKISYLRPELEPWNALNIEIEEEPNE